MKNFKNQKGISLIALIIIVVIVIGIIIYIATYKSGHKLTTEEKNTYLNLRSLITKSTLATDTNPEDRVSNFSKQDYDILGQMIKKENSSNIFSLSIDKGWLMSAYDSAETLMAKGYTYKETKEYEITYLYDGVCVAILYVRHIGNDYYLFDYEFKTIDEYIPNSVFLYIK